MHKGVGRKLSTWVLRGSTAERRENKNTRIMTLPLSLDVWILAEEGGRDHTTP